MFYNGSTVQLKEVDATINTVDSKEDVINAELNQKEKASFEIIKSWQMKRALFQDMKLKEIFYMVI